MFLIAYANATFFALVVIFKNMSNQTINAAILAHRAWVARFRKAHVGLNTEVFDLTKVQDGHRCDLGQWLLTEASISLLGEESHNIVSVCHTAFHDIAGNIVTKLKPCDSSDDVLNLMFELDSMSKKIVSHLIQAKQKI
jgi:hypothetical protein